MHRCRAVLSGRVRGRLYAAAVASLCATCGGTTTEQLIGPTASRCEIGVGASPPAIPASGSSLSLNVSAARDCTWTVASEAVWVTVTPTSGQGDGAVAISVAENSQPRSRSAAVVINESRVAINQDPAPCRFELDSQSVRIDAEGGRTAVRVSTIDGCAWRATGSADWIHILTPDGTGTGTVQMDVTRNGGLERSTTVSIAGLAFVVTQDGGLPTPPPGSPPGPEPPPASCAFSISPEQNTIVSTGGQGSIRVVTEAGCSWSASTAAGWISLQRSGGIGPETATYQVGANFSTVSERSGSITIAGRSHRVTQEACALSIDSGTPTFLPSGGPGDFRVTTGAGCTWTASSNVDWIVLTRSSAAGSEAVTYRVAPNPVGRDRSGTIVVSGRTKLVIQQALGQGG
jgi:Viral BACON domain/Putative binding domain, N-terminal